jgi:mannose-1-phosphate guanylyltransferase
MSFPIRRAFVLGAGLGTRLRPLTESLPKPLVPLWNKPLLTYAFDHLRADLGVESFLVNTHHCPEAYGVAFPEGEYEGLPVAFRHEPVLLDTAGGIANARDWLGAAEAGDSFAVYNGDILTDLPLGPAAEAHDRSGALVTMVLRGGGSLANVAFDAASGRVEDIRDLLGASPSVPRYQFTGIYLVRRAFLDWLKPGKIESVVLPLVEAIRAGQRVAGVLADEGCWSDLGKREDYLDASVLLANDAGFPRYGRHPKSIRIHPAARVAPSARVDTVSVVGADCVIDAGADIRESICWPGSRVETGAKLRRCVVRTGMVAPAGEWRDRDF